MIRVVVVDDQRLVLDGIEAVLSVEADLEVVGLAADGRQAITVVTEQQPDVVLMDIRMPRMDGIAATRQLMTLARPPHVLVLTTFDLDELVFDAVRAGASGFLLKDAPRQRLTEAIRTVASGETLVDPAVTRRLIERFARAPKPTVSVDDLTRRETDVLVEVARGLSNSEIAARLVIGEATVKTHVAGILRKHGLRDRAQAVVLAYESGLVEPGAGSP